MQVTNPDGQTDVLPAAFTVTAGTAATAGKLPIQAGLKANTPGDKHEQKADKAAERVMRMP